MSARRPGAGRGGRALALAVLLVAGGIARAAPSAAVAPDALAAGTARSPAAGGSAAPQQLDALRRMDAWIRRHRKAREPLEPAALSDLRGLLRELGRTELEDPPRAGEVRLLLLRLAAFERDAEVSALGQRALERRLEDPGGDDVARLLAPLVAEADRDPAERVALARLLAGRYLPGTLAPLLAAARASEAEVREAVRQALVGWPDAGLESFFLDELQREDGAWRAAELHLEALGADLGEATRARLRTIVGRMLIAEDWRTATRARELVRFLDGRDAVPMLIESLRVWNRRIASGSGSLRIRHELVGELRRISARSIGPDPEAWESWWRRIDEGTIELPEEDEDNLYTQASFFGLRVASDRVVFVLDRSGSMQERFGPGGRTRFQEALARLDAFLEAAGPTTRFGLVLFSDEPVRWARELRPASAAVRSRLDRWLARKEVEGGTRLREAVFDAASYRRGSLRLEELEADTIVVLCDGESESGPGWVRPWLEEINERAQLVFHCVQIGGEGDGTLRLLAELTKGDFLRVQG